LVPELTGTLLWYWAVCRREAWLMARGVRPDEDHPYLEFGRFLSQRAYSRAGRRELVLPGIRMDLVELGSDGRMVIVEVKKSSRFLAAARLQLLYYLWRLEEYGLYARGELRVPAERKRIPVDLDCVGRRDVERAVADLRVLVQQRLPPAPVRVPFCCRCAYAEFCWCDAVLVEEEP
jgi:CRISPR-associated exonuclease Cas4